ncbi:FtsX-like permease family protein [Streptomyces sp. NPDC005955]|uniref:FtsX-like permease family protein n=1 Tax=Streptomyces sp. NPDC005955 TaxID=3364738 RepID=UPI0036A0062E
MTGFVLARVRAHRLLLAAALVAVVLTTTVLATLAAFSGGIGDAALRHTLRTRDTAATALTAKAPVAPSDRRATEAAGKAVQDAARTAFDGLPFTTRALARSGPYALPRSLQPPAARDGNPYLTHFSSLDSTQVRIVRGRAPDASRRGEVEVALPETAAAELGVHPGHREAALTVTDRLDGPAVRVRVVGVYRPVAADAPYWQLDGLRGRGVQKVSFTTYGPLLTDPAVLATAGRVSTGETSWLAVADFSAMSTGRIDALRDAAREGVASLRGSAALGGSTDVTTGLPGVLDRAERATLVSRSTLLIVALQLSLLAGYTLLLVARLLSAERDGETGLLRARGGSRGRIGTLAAVEALMLALPAALLAPLLAGPLTELLAGQGALARIGLRVDGVASGGVWLVAGAVALGCALAVTLPALTSDGATRGRGRALPGPLRAGADVALVAVAGIAYWQLDRQTAQSGVFGKDGSGQPGIDPLLVAAPALALLAGTALTLRLLPPAARLAERRAASGRGLTSALAGWQLSRRPLRGAGPVLLLVLAVAMGMLAIGQGSSWDRSQDDQADFRAGASVRVQTAGVAGLGHAGRYAELPGVREAVPALRATAQLSGDREATVLALDTARGAEHVLTRPDLGELTDGAAPRSAGITAARDGTRLPKDTTRLELDVRLSAKPDPGGVAPDDDSRPPKDASHEPPRVAVLVEDRYGLSYRLPAGTLTADGRTRTLSVDLLGAAESAAGEPARPLTFIGLELDVPQPVGVPERHVLTVAALRAADGGTEAAPVRLGSPWRAKSAVARADDALSEQARPTRPELTGPDAQDPRITARYGTGYTPGGSFWSGEDNTVTVRIMADRSVPEEVPAIATDQYLKVLGARPGDRVDVALAGTNVPVRIERSVRALPTTGPDGRAPVATNGEGADATGAATSAADRDGGALLLDLNAVNRILTQRDGTGVSPTEWWLTTAPGQSAEAAAALRARSDTDPATVLVRDEIAQGLRDDPLGAGPGTALTAVAVAAAALAAVGFGVSTAGALRERSTEFAVLRALGAPRRRLARLVAAEQGVLVCLALLVGAALGTVLTRAVVPLILLTPDATRPVPPVLVELPVGQVLLLLALVAAGPLLITAALPLRRPANLATALGAAVER